MSELLYFYHYLYSSTNLKFPNLNSKLTFNKNFLCGKKCKTDGQSSTEFRIRKSTIFLSNSNSIWFFKLLLIVSNFLNSSWNNFNCFLLWFFLFLWKDWESLSCWSTQDVCKFLWEFTYEINIIFEKIKLEIRQSSDASCLPSHIFLDTQITLSSKKFHLFSNFCTKSLGINLHYWAKGFFSFAKSKKSSNIPKNELSLTPWIKPFLSLDFLHYVHLLLFDLLKKLVIHVQNRQLPGAFWLPCVLTMFVRMSLVYFNLFAISRFVLSKAVASGYCSLSPFLLT